MSYWVTSNAGLTSNGTIQVNLSVEAPRMDRKTSANNMDMGGRWASYPSAGKWVPALVGKKKKTQCEFVDECPQLSKVGQLLLWQHFAVSDDKVGSKKRQGPRPWLLLKCLATVSMPCHVMSPLSRHVMCHPLTKGRRSMMRHIFQDCSVSNTYCGHIDLHVQASASPKFFCVFICVLNLLLRWSLCPCLVSPSARKVCDQLTSFFKLILMFSSARLPNEVRRTAFPRLCRSIAGYSLMGCAVPDITGWSMIFIFTFYYNVG